MDETERMDIEIARGFIFPVLDEIIKNGLLTRDVKLIMYGKITMAHAAGIITLDEFGELNEKLDLVDGEVQDALEIALTGSVA